MCDIATARASAPPTLQPKSVRPGASAPEAQIFPLVFRDLFADLVGEGQRLHLIRRHVAFELETIPMRLGAHRAALRGHLRTGERRAPADARLQAIGLRQLAVAADGVDAFDDARLMRPLFRI